MGEPFSDCQEEGGDTITVSCLQEEGCISELSIRLSTFPSLSVLPRDPTHLREREVPGELLTVSDLLRRAHQPFVKVEL